jgi:hypothetical protein
MFRSTHMDCNSKNSDLLFSYVNICIYLTKSMQQGCISGESGFYVRTYTVIRVFFYFYGFYPCSAKCIHLLQVTKNQTNQWLQKTKKKEVFLNEYLTR